MRKLFFVIILALAACGKTPAPGSMDSLFVSSQIVEQQGFSTIDAAATAGIRMAVASSTQFERGGGILLGPNGKYYFTAPVGGSNAGEVKFKVEFSNTFKIVAVYHTHPAKCPVCETDLSDYFSNMDIKTALNLNLVSYIGIIKTHSVSKFVPHHDVIDKVDAGRGDGTYTSVSLGKEVGRF